MGVDKKAISIKIPPDVLLNDVRFPKKMPIKPNFPVHLNTKNNAIPIPSKIRDTKSNTLNNSPKIYTPKIILKNAPTLENYEGISGFSYT
ncbi:MAG: hypothetical protein ACFFG0_15825 [Candidatus Thorarchaeota archaeon]